MITDTVTLHCTVDITEALTESDSEYWAELSWVSDTSAPLATGSHAPSCFGCHLSFWLDCRIPQQIRMETLVTGLCERELRQARYVKSVVGASAVSHCPRPRIDRWNHVCTSLESRLALRGFFQSFILIRFFRSAPADAWRSWPKNLNIKRIKLRSPAKGAFEATWHRHDSICLFRTGPKAKPDGIKAHSHTHTA